MAKDKERLDVLLVNRGLAPSREKAKTLRVEFYSHRKNIMDKLGMKSVSALTIYAVMHGYVDINKI